MDEHESQLFSGLLVSLEGVTVLEKPRVSREVSEPQEFSVACLDLALASRTDDWYPSF